MVSRVLEKYSVTEHPIINKFIGIVDQAFLERLVNYECYWNWVGPELTENEIQVIVKKYQTTTDELDDTSSDDGNALNSLADEDFDVGGTMKGLLKLNPETAADLENNHCIRFITKARAVAKKIFWLIYLKRFDEAGILLEEMRAQLFSAQVESNKILVNNLNGSAAAQTNCLFSLSDPEVNLGYRYIFDGLEAYLMLKDNGEKSWSAAKCKYEPELEDLGTKIQVIVLYFKLGFLTDGRKYYVDLRDTIKKLIELDLNTSHWYRGLYFSYRGQRRARSLSESPTEKESLAALKAYHLDPHNIFNIGCLCKDLTELFRNEVEDTSNWPLKYGDMNFESPQDMLQFLKGKAGEIKNQSKDLIAAKMEKPFLDLVGAFSSILRGRYRDLDLAAEFIEFALQINPKSTRALHWKALLTMKQDLTFDGRLKAEQILRQIDDEYAFYPLLDLLSLLLSDLNKNEEEIRKCLVENIAKPEIWGKIGISRLYFLQGCLNFMVKDYKQAFANWTESLALHSAADHFGGIDLDASRFSWSRYVLNFPNIKYQLNALDKQTLPEDKRLLLDTMAERIEKAAQKAFLFHQRQQGRNNSTANTNWGTRNNVGRGHTGSGTGSGSYIPPAARLPMAAVSPRSRYANPGRSLADEDDNWRKK